MPVNSLTGSSIARKKMKSYLENVVFQLIQRYLHISRISWMRIMLLYLNIGEAVAKATAIDAPDPAVSYQIESIANTTTLNHSEQTRLQ